MTTKEKKEAIDDVIRLFKDNTEELNQTQPWDYIVERRKHALEYNETEDITINLSFDDKELKKILSAKLITMYEDALEYEEAKHDDTKEELADVTCEGPTNTIQEAVLVQKFREKLNDFRNCKTSFQELYNTLNLI
mgnify:CR=1 FL=1